MIIGKCNLGEKNNLGEKMEKMEKMENMEKRRADFDVRNEAEGWAPKYGNSRLSA